MTEKTPERVGYYECRLKSFVLSDNLELVQREFFKSVNLGIDSLRIESHQAIVSREGKAYVLNLSEEGFSLEDSSISYTEAAPVCQALRKLAEEEVIKAQFNNFLAKRATNRLVQAVLAPKEKPAKPTPQGGPKGGLPIALIKGKCVMAVGKVITTPKAANDDNEQKALRRA